MEARKLQAPETPEIWTEAKLVDITDARIKGNAYKIYLYLKARQGRKGTAWPKIATIAKENHVCRQTVINAIKQLEKAGFLTVKRVNGGLRQRNHYTAHRTQQNPGRKSRAYFLDPKSTGVYKDTNRTKFSYRQSSDFDPEVKEIVENHLRVCSIAREATKNHPEKLTALHFKARKLINLHGLEQVKAAVTEFSPKANQGDGWGLIIKGAIILNGRQATKKEVEQHETAKREQTTKPIIDKAAQLDEEMTTRSMALQNSHTSQRTPEPVELMGDGGGDVVDYTHQERRQQKRSQQARELLNKPKIKAEPTRQRLRSGKSTQKRQRERKKEEKLIKRCLHNSGFKNDPPKSLPPKSLAEQIQALRAEVPAERPAAAG